ncbi:hypothetical protein QTH89_14700 [Variovorax sp. J22G21]|uniref:hypothetical protein n=1 Tax=Variovorax fucosicus TaxID=3053517 RepID=UPI002578FEA7|nr:MULTISPECIES: hypothetical protein [unclassified Variovorax]MDM0037672.1 hypothetical protein [Variovorax sp. J22R193]MDM0062448.1 hypothetical protein [Variovorax sp. J22G21]
MTHTAELTPAEQARRVVVRTASVWRIAPASPREVARRAPHGHVPARIMRRIRAAAAAASRPALAHSW